MNRQEVNRRKFMKGVLGSAAMMSALPQEALSLRAEGGRAVEDQVTKPDESTPKPKYSVKFAVIGINHPHIYGMVGAMLRGGGEFVALYAKEPDLVAALTKRFPQPKIAKSEDEILNDKSIPLVLSSIVPNERAPLGIRVMQHGKDYLSDKPGITSLEQLAEVRRVQAQTHQIYSIMYSERLENRATVKAGELVKAGAIGRVVQTIGLGPHRMDVKTRPPWYFDYAYSGGIICDIGSHQADQFLFFTNSTQAEVVASQYGNVAHPQYPKFQDFGDMMLRGDGGAGYVRLDWFTPDGLDTWGDGRLTILGTEGFIEIRKNTDIAGRGPGSYLFMADNKEMRYIDCKNQELPFGPQLISDVVNRTDTAMSQAHCLLSMELVLKAQQQAQRVTFKT
jgi:predicted dehydrogenase